MLYFNFVAVLHSNPIATLTNIQCKEQFSYKNKNQTQITKKKKIKFINNHKISTISIYAPFQHPTWYSCPTFSRGTILNIFKFFLKMIVLCSSSPPLHFRSWPTLYIYLVELLLTKVRLRVTLLASGMSSSNSQSLHSSTWEKKTFLSYATNSLPITHSINTICIWINLHLNK